MISSPFLRAATAASALLILVPLSAQPLAAAVPTAAASEAAGAERSLSEWLLRMHEASRQRSYTGTLVVSSGGLMASSRIWHACDGDKQVERVEALTGTPRSTFRRNDEVITFSPQSKVAVAERREALSLFPHLLQSADTAIEQYYGARLQGSERVAGFEADVLLIQPRDKLRFGYRVWSEKRTGLVIKLQTLGLQGQVLEQVAFSELQLDAPVSMSKLTEMMGKVEGYKVESPDLVRTTAQEEGWRLRAPVPGFNAMSCHRRPASGASAADKSDPGNGTLQWVFSDGLAAVSLFIESYDRRRHAREGLLSMGATHTLMRRLDTPTGTWWLTVVGEVPAQTLQAFAQGLERSK